MADPQDSASILDKLGGPAESIKQFDAFPKLPSTYQRRSDSRGFLTILIGLLCFVLVLNDIGEFIWGWPEFHFSMDKEVHSYIPINLDIIVNMPCKFISVDLRDTLGDRLHLTGGFRRDGTTFDVAQAQKLHEQSANSETSFILQTRQTRGLLAALFRGDRTEFKPTYKHAATDNACRIYGTMVAKKVTANLHITSLGHGYASAVHVDHTAMNMSHIISEFSFGPYFPHIVQPLDNTYSLTHHPFTAYQYFLSVVPTKYKPARARRAMRTHQYSVTNYVRELEHGIGTPGIFFKFDLDPLSIEVEEKTTTLIQFLIRVVGVVGGVWCCMGWAVKLSFRAYEAVTGTSEGDEPIVAVESTGVKRRWGGGELKKRVVQQGNGWVVTGESDWGGNSPAVTPSPYAGGFAPSPGYASSFPLPPSAPPTASHGAGFFPPPRSAAQSTFPHHQRQFSGTSNLPPPTTPLGQHSPSPSNAGSSPGRALNGPNGQPMSEKDKAFKDR